MSNGHPSLSHRHSDPNGSPTGVQPRNPRKSRVKFHSIPRGRRIVRRFRAAVRAIPAACLHVPTLTATSPEVGQAQIRSGRQRP